MIFAIGDLHLDYYGEKPMDIFGSNWIGHEEKIFNNWKDVVEDEDIVLLPGDISWSLKLLDAYHDLRRIDELPGRKIITKGNHDYWWSGQKKMKDLDLKTIGFLQNNSFKYNDIGIFGSRGWTPRDAANFDSHDEKIFNRELHRLELSLSSIEGEVKKRVVMLHYPPFNLDLTPNEFVDLMVRYDVDICIYGHLHSEGHRFIVEGEVEGIQFHCVASDYMNFKLKEIA
ncbi:MAG: serine/threonine protein phosphatase [Tissierellia bacterium]|nr:serine/threonine protein phosphatase [Tissierellia bacterium]